ncbi:MAG TPA: metalloregulator ArsR/SmtB family transcription factor [Pseudonocardiaceae bacterium]|nr:metalloregulator ArsR/SmtB family transcription factor [Pseudonocardiaceae bacterium]
MDPVSEPSATLRPADAIGVETVARFARVLGDPARLRLVEFLLDHEHNVTDCIAHTGLSQSRVSVHLACLVDCGYTQVRRVGRFAYHRVSDPRVAKLVELLRALASDPPSS